MKFRIINSILMALFLSSAMSGWITWINLGFVADFPIRWFEAFKMGWPPATVIAFLIGPSVQKISRRLVQIGASAEQA